MTDTERIDDTTARVSAVVVAGHRGERRVIEAALDSDEPQVRAAALGATVRSASMPTPIGGSASSSEVTSTLLGGLRDADASVRRRAAMEIGRWSAADPGPAADDTERLADGLVERFTVGDDSPVCEVVAFACGELRMGVDPTEPSDDADLVGAQELAAARARVVQALSEQATGHDDHLCRESAVAALGSIGDPDGIEAVLSGCEDRATVRRRAVLALAAFDDARATAALVGALEDRDLQVRQAAEELLAIEDGEAT